MAVVLQIPLMPSAHFQMSLCEMLNVSLGAAISYNHTFLDPGFLNNPFKTLIQSVFDFTNINICFLRMLCISGIETNILKILQNLEKSECSGIIFSVKNSTLKHVIEEVTTGKYMYVKCEAIILCNFNYVGILENEN